MELADWELWGILAVAVGSLLTLVFIAPQRARCWRCKNEYTRNDMSTFMDEKLTKEDIREGRGLCDFCRRELRAIGWRSLATGGDEVLYEVRMHDVEMRRMYEANKERFGGATRTTALISGIILMLTGLAEIAMSGIRYAHLSSLILVFGGIAVPLSVRGIWWVRERKRDGPGRVVSMKMTKGTVKTIGNAGDVSIDAMRTTIWGVFVGAFIASYVTLYVAMVFSTSHPLSGWIASPIAAAAGALLAIGFLMVFLSVMRMSPRIILAWTDRLANWALRKDRNH